jgi:hypothetical protein
MVIVVIVTIFLLFPPPIQAIIVDCGTVSFVIAVNAESNIRRK